MNPELAILVGTAATLGVTHTAIGLDHSLPFIMLGRARAWSLPRTLSIAAACGVAHVLSSVVVGTVGVTLGVAVSSLKWFEATRGYWVGWALVAFGTLYALISLFKLGRGGVHQHVHVHRDGTIHRHYHGHGKTETRVGASHHVTKERLTDSAWQHSNLFASLFIVFLLGPCEALLPLMMAPSLQSSWRGSFIVAVVFSCCTVGTMLVLVTAGWFGLRGAWLSRLEPHLNWLSGVAIASTGLGIHFLGL